MQWLLQDVDGVCENYFGVGWGPDFNGAGENKDVYLQNDSAYHSVEAPCYVDIFQYILFFIMNLLLGFHEIWCHSST